MARRLRLQFAGAFYYVASRGNRGDAVFRDHADFESFLHTLGETCHRTGWRVHAFCLLPHQIELLLETPRPNLVIGMKWLLGVYTNRHNRRHAQHGHLFAGRYRSIVICPSAEYLATVADAIHLAPDRASLIPAEANLADYAWSSLRHHLDPTRSPSWLSVEASVMGAAAATDKLAGHVSLERSLERKRPAREEPSWMRGHWCFGDSRFKSSLVKRLARRAGSVQSGPERRELAETKAERIARDEMKRRRWTVTDLASRTKGDIEKLKIALRLRSEATVTLGWIAARLRMGTPTYLAHLLYWHRRGVSARRAAQRRAPSGEAHRTTQDRTELGGTIELRTDPNHGAAPTHFDPTFD